MFSHVKALAENFSEKAWNTAFKAYNKFLAEGDPDACHELSRRCSTDLSQVRAYYALLQGRLENDVRFTDEVGWTAVYALTFRVDSATKFGDLISIPAGPRRALRRHLEEASDFIGDIHLSTLAIMLPRDGLDMPPDYALDLVQVSTNGGDYSHALPTPNPLDPPMTPAKLVMFVTFHIGDADIGQYTKLEDSDDLLGLCLQVAIDATGFEWDLTEVCGSRARLIGGAEATYTLGETIAGDLADEMRDDIINLLNSKKNLANPKVVLRCVPVAMREVPVQGQPYAICAELQVGDKILRQYEFGATTSPAFVLGFLSEVISMVRPKGVIELSNERA